LSQVGELGRCSRLTLIQIFPPTSTPAAVSPDIYNIWKGRCQYTAFEKRWRQRGRWLSIRAWGRWVAVRGIVSSENPKAWVLQGSFYHIILGSWSPGGLIAQYGGAFWGLLPYVKVSLSARVESNLSVRERRGLRERVHCDFIV